VDTFSTATGRRTRSTAAAASNGRREHAAERASDEPESARGDAVGGPSEVVRTTALVDGHVLDCDEAAVSHENK